MARMLNGKRELALTRSACPRFSTGGYFPLRINKFTQLFRVFIIKYLCVIYTKLTLFRGI